MELLVSHCEREGFPCINAAQLQATAMDGVGSMERTLAA